MSPHALKVISTVHSYKSQLVYFQRCGRYTPLHLHTHKHTECTPVIRVAAVACIIIYLLVFLLRLINLHIQRVLRFIFIFRHWNCVIISRLALHILIYV